VVRYAFTLIELIFAIVIIGITVISLPMMTQVTSKGIDESIVQEAIFAAATELNEAVTRHWDDNSFDVNTTDTYSRVITTAIGTATGCNNITRLRPGHINQERHRRCTDVNSTVSGASTNANINSFDDATHTKDKMFNEDKTEAAGYKELYKSALTVSNPISNPVSFGSLTKSRDIKALQLIVSDSEGTIIKLTTYSFNIGEIDYYERSF